jgi:hypothetical protein
MVSDRRLPFLGPLSVPSRSRPRALVSSGGYAGFATVMQLPRTVCLLSRGYHQSVTLWLPNLGRLWLPPDGYDMVTKPSAVCGYHQMVTIWLHNPRQSVVTAKWLRYGYTTLGSLWLPLNGYDMVNKLSVITGPPQQFQTTISELFIWLPHSNIISETYGSCYIQIPARH